MSDAIVDFLNTEEMTKAYRKAFPTVITVEDAMRQALEVLDEIERLRAAIMSAVKEMDDSHVTLGKYGLCALCGATDGSWPCVHRIVLDELKEAVRGD